MSLIMSIIYKCLRKPTMSKLFKFLRKPTSDTYALIFLVSMVLTTFFFELMYVLPHVHEDNLLITYFHLVMGIFILHNILGNLFLIRTTETSIRKLILPSVLQPQWRFCACCECNAPPRSYHCAVCNICTLKRDHHCVFAGTCIGYFNFRYFYCLLIYMTIGAVYCSILNMFFIWDVLGGFTLSNLFKHTFPFMFWIFGRLTLKTMIWSMISVLDISAFLLSFGLLLHHGSLLVANQTMYERGKSIFQYSLNNWRLNVQESLGDRWYLIWLSPWIKSKLPRDGVFFPTFKDFKTKSSKNK